LVIDTAILILWCIKAAGIAVFFVFQ